jgi:hypothetical protein
MFVKDTAYNMDRFNIATATKVAAVSGVSAEVPAITDEMLNQGLITRINKFKNNAGVIQVKGPIHVDFFKGI